MSYVILSYGLILVFCLLELTNLGLFSCKFITLTRELSTIYFYRCFFRFY